MTKIIAIKGEDRVLLVQQSAVQGRPGPAGSGIASGGTTGQVLAKASDDDYDSEWVTVGGIGVATGTVTSVGLVVPSGLVASGSPVTSSGTFTIAYASGVRAYTAAEATKLAEIASGATASSGTVVSVGLTVPSGLVVSGTPVTTSGSIAITYASGVQAYSSTEAAKLAGIASGATASNGTVTNVALQMPSGLTVAGSPVTTSGSIIVAYVSGVQAYTATEANKLATVASGAQVNVSTNLSYEGNSRALSSSTGSGIILPLFTDSDAGLVGGSGGGTGNFLRADGQWAAPPAASGTGGGTVTSVNLLVPSGLVVSGGPIVSSGSLILSYASGVQAYTSTESVKLQSIASGATANNGTVTSVGLQVPSGLVVTGNNIVSSGTLAITYASGIQAYSSTESSKLATIELGAQVNVRADWTAASGDTQILNKPPLGSAAALNVGTASGNVVQLDGTGRLPAVDGSLLTGLPAVGSGSSGQQYATGHWICPVVGVAATATAMAADGTIYFHPFDLRRSITVGALGARVNTAATGSIQLAIYASVNGEPNGAPIGATTSLSAAAAGVVSDDVTDFNLTGGVVYWMASIADAAVGLQYIATSSTYAGSVVGSPTLAQLASSASAVGSMRQITGQTFGTWPTLSAGGTTVQTFTLRGGTVYLQVAALI